jgi:hypothetical protein
MYSLSEQSNGRPKAIHVTGPNGYFVSGKLFGNESTTTTTNPLAAADVTLPTLSYNDNCATDTTTDNTDNASISTQYNTEKIDNIDKPQ